MHAITNILKEATINKWPYPKTFETLKANGLIRYEVRFSPYYKATFEMNTGETLVEHNLDGYVPVAVQASFNNHNIKKAIEKHITEQTHYVDFLHDIAANGATHYKVDIAQRTVTYFNDLEDQQHIEYVPGI